MKYNICIIDYFTKDFIKENSLNCIGVAPNIMQAEAQGHGQAIVQIIVEVNPKASWCFIAIGKNTSASDILYWLNYIYKKNISNIINMSFGSRVFF